MCAAPPASDSDRKVSRRQEFQQYDGLVSGSAEAFVATCADVPSLNMSPLHVAESLPKHPESSCDFEEECFSRHELSQSQLCVCLSGPDVAQAPQYAHCSPHMVESFGNAMGNTYHCSHCRLKCRDCKGRVARVGKSTGEILYSQRKDCAVTPVPGPSHMTLLADGDLVSSPGAPGTLDKNGQVTYPFDVRRIALRSDKLRLLLEKDHQKASEYAVKIPKKKEQQVIRTASGEPIGATFEGSTRPAQPTPKSAPPTDSRTSSSAGVPEMGSIMATVREMLATKYKAAPQQPDVSMDHQKPLVDQIRELEEHAAELGGLPETPHGPSHEPAVSEPRGGYTQGSMSSRGYDPDASDAWEVLRLP